MNKDKSTKPSNSDEPESSYDRFREFTRKLIQVPKEEVDKLAKEEQAKKSVVPKQK